MLPKNVATEEKNQSHEEVTAKQTTDSPPMRHRSKSFIASANLFKKKQKSEPSPSLIFQFSELEKKILSNPIFFYLPRGIAIDEPTHALENIIYAGVNAHQGTLRTAEQALVPFTEQHGESFYSTAFSEQLPEGKKPSRTDKRAPAFYFFMLPIVVTQSSENPPTFSAKFDEENIEDLDLYLSFISEQARNLSKDSKKILTTVLQLTNMPFAEYTPEVEHAISDAILRLTRTIWKNPRDDAAIKKKSQFFWTTTPSLETYIHANFCTLSKQRISADRYLSKAICSDVLVGDARTRQRPEELDSAYLRATTIPHGHWGQHHYPAPTHFSATRATPVPPYPQSPSCPPKQPSAPFFTPQEDSARLYPNLDMLEAHTDSAHLQEQRSFTPQHSGQQKHVTEDAEMTSIAPTEDGTKLTISGLSGGKLA